MSSLSLDAWIALLVLVGAIVLLVTKRLPIQITALSIPVVLFVTGVIDEASVALQGFGNRAVIALGAVFVVGAGLQDSGLATLIARALRRVGGQRPARLVILVAFSVALLSSVMPNAATVAVLLPSVVGLCRRAKIPPSRLLMPFSFAAVLGGNVTLIGTASNLLVSDHLRAARDTGFGIFDFTPVGGAIVIVGVFYMWIASRYWLPGRTTADRMLEEHLPRELAQSYDVTQSLYRLKIFDHSGLAGKTIAEAQVGARYRLSVVMVVRPKKIGFQYLDPTPELLLQGNDEIYVEGNDQDAVELSLTEDVQLCLPAEQHLERVMDHGVTFAEVTLAPRSDVVGKTIRELEIRRRYGLNVVALWRLGESVREGLAETPLREGDAFLVTGAPRHIVDLAKDPAYIVISDVSEEEGLEDVRHAPVAALLLALAIVPPILGWAPLQVSALASALLMILTGCVSLERAERALDWKVLFLIIGTLPLGTAIQTTGLATEASEALIAATRDIGKPALLAALFAVSALFSITCSNVAAANIIAPVALSAAAASGLELTQTLLAVAYGCSCAFLIPFTNQCHIMVMGPGGYRTRDFLRFGAGLSVAVMVVAVALLLR